MCEPYSQSGLACMGLTPVWRHGTVICTESLDIVDRALEWAVGPQPQSSSTPGCLNACEITGPVVAGHLSLEHLSGRRIAQQSPNLGATVACVMMRTSDRFGVGIPMRGVAWPKMGGCLLQVRRSATCYILSSYIGTELCRVAAVGDRSLNANCRFLRFVTVLWL